MPSIEEILKMNDEELKAVNKRLAIKGFMMFMALMTAKFAVIIGLNKLGRRLNKKPTIKAWEFTK